MLRVSRGCSLAPQSHNLNNIKRINTRPDGNEVVLHLIECYCGCSFQMEN